MAKKHVDEYYNKICSDYHELLETLHEMEELVQENIVGPKLLENIEKLIAPMKQNYERWSYMMFLLNQPIKKEKQKVYKNVEGKKLKGLSKNNSLGFVLAEDKKVINDLKNSFKDC